MCCFKIASPYLFEFLLKIFDEHPILSIWEPPPRSPALPLCPQHHSYCAPTKEGRLETSHGLCLRIDNDSIPQAATLI